MTLTVGSCDRFLRENLGGSPASRSVMDCVNDTGKWFIAAHSWRWARGQSTVLPQVSGQSYIDLPAGIRSIDGLFVENALTYYVQEMTLREILELRTSTIAAQLDQFKWAANYRTVAATATAAQRLQPILELWPTPAESVTEAFRLFYTGAWADLTDDSDGVLIPTWLEPLFLSVLSVVAKGYDEHDVADVPMRLERLVGSKAWDDMCRYDGSLQFALGPEMKGAASGETLVNIPRWSSFRQDGPS